MTAGATGQASDEADSEALSEGSDGPGDMAFRSDGRAVGVGELGIGGIDRIDGVLAGAKQAAEAQERRTSRQVRHARSIAT